MSENSQRKSTTKLYKVWTTMKQRCHNAACREYPYYGARGIAVCDRWRKSFDLFAADMGIRPDGATLDRINNDGDYEPSNCRWATMRDQVRNRSITKLTEENVAEIKADILAGVRPTFLAAKYHVCPSHISAIKYGRFWVGVVAARRDPVTLEQNRAPNSSTPLAAGDA